MSNCGRGGTVAVDGEQILQRDPSGSSAAMLRIWQGPILMSAPIVSPIVNATRIPTGAVRRQREHTAGHLVSDTAVQNLRDQIITDLRQSVLEGNDCALLIARRTAEAARDPTYLARVAGPARR